MQHLVGTLQKKYFKKDQIKMIYADNIVETRIINFPDIKWN